MGDRVQHLQELQSHPVQQPGENSSLNQPLTPPQIFDSNHKVDYTEPSQQLMVTLNQKLTEVETVVLQMQAKSDGKKETYGVEAWKLVALILDRIFMGLYLTASILLIAFYFPRPAWDVTE